MSITPQSFARLALLADELGMSGSATVEHAIAVLADERALPWTTHQDGVDLLEQRAAEAAKRGDGRSRTRPREEKPAG